MQVLKLDPCLSIGDKVICISYVDYILFWATNEKFINELAGRLCDQGVLLEQEDDAAGFLGVNMTKTVDDKIGLT